LTVFTDLNLAVHLNDRFEFGAAETLLEEIFDDPASAALRPLTCGWVLSSWGQCQALLGRYPEADAAFFEALACYQRADISSEDRARHCRQSGYYRAIAALDAGSPEAQHLVEEVTGPLDEAIKRSAAAAGSAASYHQHLLVRCLWLRPDLSALRQAYLNEQPVWCSGDRHPWPLIDCYRALLLNSAGGDQEDVKALFVRAINGIAAERHGAVLHLVGGMIATVASCLIDDPSASELAHRLIARAEAHLPAAAGPVELLRAVLDRPGLERVAEALSALPFYYH
jgi:hypothetical protein